MVRILNHGVPGVGERGRDAGTIHGDGRRRINSQDAKDEGENGCQPDREKRIEREDQGIHDEPKEEYVKTAEEESLPVHIRLVAQIPRQLVGEPCKYVGEDQKNENSSDRGPELEIVGHHGLACEEVATQVREEGDENEQIGQLQGAGPVAIGKTYGRASEGHVIIMMVWLIFAIVNAVLEEVRQPPRKF